MKGSEMMAWILSAMTVASRINDMRYGELECLEIKEDLAMIMYRHEKLLKRWVRHSELLRPMFMKSLEKSGCHIPELREHIYKYRTVYAQVLNHSYLYN